MNYEIREAILSKEALTIDDIVMLTGRSKGTASRLLIEWKRYCQKELGRLRINVDGTIHILDYFFAMGIDPKDPGVRYVKRKKFEDDRAPAERAKRSVCI